MASLIENFKQYKNASEWRPFGMFDLIDEDKLTYFDKLFIEVTLFIEMYDFTSGMTFDDKSENFFLQIFKRVNRELDKTDNVEMRNKQCKMILDNYKQHYNSWMKNKKAVHKGYLLIAYVNRIDISHKNNYIDKRYDIETSKFGNFKFKEELFNATMDRMVNFHLENEIPLLFDREDIDMWDKFEVIKTIMLLQEQRGYKEKDYYE